MDMEGPFWTSELLQDGHGQIVTGSSDRRVRVWCAKTFKCVEQYRVPAKAPVVQVEFDAAKVVGAAGKEVFVWSRTGNRRLLSRMGGHSEIRSMGVTDSNVAVDCTDGTIRVCDLCSRRCTRTFSMHTEPVIGVMDTATQSMVSGSDGTVQLFDARSGKRFGSLFKDVYFSSFSCLQYRPLDQNLFVTTMGGFLYCYDIRKRAHCCYGMVSLEAITCMDTPSYSRSTIGFGGVDGQEKLKDTSCKSMSSFVVRPTNRLVGPVHLPGSPVLSMALGMTRLVSCHGDGSINQWQLGESTSVVENLAVAMEIATGN